MSKAFQIIKGFAQNPSDSADLAFKKMLILVLALCCCGAGITWTLVYYAVFGIGFTMSLPLIFTVIVGSMILISNQLADHRPLVYAQLVCMTLISPLIQWSIGSMDQSGLVIVWSFLGPLGAIIFLSFRQSLFWIALFLGIVIVSAVFEPALLGVQLEVSPQVKISFYIMNLGVSSIIIFATVAWFVKTIQFERGRSESLLQKIKTLFGQHVSTEVANELISKDNSTSESKTMEVTVMFLDIRDFTLFADSRAPKEVANFQNTLFSEFIMIVRENKGIVLQILGDGILAVFGAPIISKTHPVDAVRSGFMMLEKTKDLYEMGQVPQIKIGIGLHTGKIIAGEIGNEYRKSYSITGSNVIIASRIEQLNKKLESQFLISEAVYERIKEIEPNGTLEGSYELKGISGTVNIYRLV